MDAALRRALKPNGDRAPGCDAELVVAYAEDRLGRLERQSLEGHLARCAACRALAATVAEESLPETAEPAPGLGPARGWLRWQWAAPAMAGLLVVGSVIVWQREKVVQSPAPVAQVRPLADAPRVETERAAEPPAPAEAPLRQRVRAAADRRSANEGAAAAPAAPPPAQAAPPAPTAQAAQSVDSALEENKPQAKRDDALAKEKDKDLALTRREAADQVGGMRLVATPADEARQLRGAYALRPATFSPLPEGAPLLNSTRRDAAIWAVSSAGRIFRSNDNGKTWEKLTSPTTNDLVAVQWESESSLLVTDREGKQHRVAP